MWLLFHFCKLSKGSHGILSSIILSYHIFYFRTIYTNSAFSGSQKDMLVLASKCYSTFLVLARMVILLYFSLTAFSNPHVHVDTEAVEARASLSG